MQCHAMRRMCYTATQLIGQQGRRFGAIKGMMYITGLAVVVGVIIKMDDA